MKKILNKISKLGKPYYILPIITLLFLTGFIGSYLFPNTVLDTYVINMTETDGDEELLLPLSATDAVTYEMNTGTLAMRGIQVGINKQGQALSGTTLVYRVYAEGNCVSENRYAVGNGDDLQYVYLPFENQKDCVGKLKITFQLENEGGDRSCSACPYGKPYGSKRCGDNARTDRYTGAADRGAGGCFFKMQLYLHA